MRQDEPNEDHYSTSFVPNAAHPAIERETISQAVQDLGQATSAPHRPMCYTIDECNVMLAAKLPERP